MDTVIARHPLADALAGSVTRAATNAIASSGLVFPIRVVQVSARVSVSGMRLFDEYDRDDSSPSPTSEDLFSFLNRSARLDVVNIRAEVERWFGDIRPMSRRSCAGG